MLLLLVASACTEETVPTDAGVDVDASDSTVVIDGQFVPDVPSWDATSDTASLTDAADTGPGLCPGTCRPDDIRSCDGRVGSCALWASEPACTLMSGELEEGSPCEYVDQCGPGLACFMRATGGVCGRVCCIGDPSACEGDTECTGVGMLLDGTLTGYGECRAPRTCEFFGTSCEAGEGCYIIDTERNECRRAGEGMLNAACTENVDCAPGFSCVGAFDRMCVRNCRIGESDSCPPDEGDCRAYPDGPSGIGLCSG